MSLYLEQSTSAHHLDILFTSLESTSEDISILTVFVHGTVYLSTSPWHPLYQFSEDVFSLSLHLEQSTSTHHLDILFTSLQSTSWRPIYSHCPCTWNSPPQHITLTSSLPVFKASHEDLPLLTVLPATANYPCSDSSWLWTLFVQCSTINYSLYIFVQQDNFSIKTFGNNIQNVTPRTSVIALQLINPDSSHSRHIYRDCDVVFIECIVTDVCWHNEDVNPCRKWLS